MAVLSKQGCVITSMFAALLNSSRHRSNDDPCGLIQNTHKESNFGDDLDHILDRDLDKNYGSVFCMFLASWIVQDSLRKPLIFYTFIPSS